MKVLVFTILAPPWLLWTNNRGRVYTFDRIGCIRKTMLIGGPFDTFIYNVGFETTCDRLFISEEIIPNRKIAPQKFLPIYNSLNQFKAVGCMFVVIP
jgi:hypothetical protein